MSSECRFCQNKDTRGVVLNIPFGDLGKGPVSVSLCSIHQRDYEAKKTEPPFQVRAQ